MSLSKEQARRSALNHDSQWINDSGCNINMVCVFCEMLIETEEGAEPCFRGAKAGGEQEKGYCYIEKDGRKQCVCHSCAYENLDFHESGERILKEGKKVPSRALAMEDFS